MKERIVRLPCQTGTTAYCLYDGRLLECRVVKFIIYGPSAFVYLESKPFAYPILTISMNVEDLGEVWFLSEEEGKQKMKEGKQ